MPKYTVQDFTNASVSERLNILDEMIRRERYIKEAAESIGSSMVDFLDSKNWSNIENILLKYDMTKSFDVENIGNQGMTHKVDINAMDAKTIIAQASPEHQKNVFIYSSYRIDLGEDLLKELETLNMNNPEIGTGKYNQLKELADDYLLHTKDYKEEGVFRKIKLL